MYKQSSNHACVYVFSDGIEPLIKLCKNDNADVREAASMALANLTTANMNNCRSVKQHYNERI